LKQIRKRKRELASRIAKLEGRKRQKALRARYTSVLAVPSCTWEQGADAVLDFVRNSELKPVGRGFLVVPEMATSTQEWVESISRRKALRETRKLIM
jgi:hypothetical protein